MKKIFFKLLPVLFISIACSNHDNTIKNLDIEVREKLENLYLNYIKLSGYELNELDHLIKVEDNKVIRLYFPLFYNGEIHYDSTSIQEISSFTNLQELNLFGLKYYPNGIENIKTLKYLRVNLKKFNNFPFEKFKDKRLETLQVDSLQDSKLIESIYDLISLKELIIRTSEIKKLSIKISNFKNVEELFIEGKINTLPEEIKSCSKLKTLKICSDSLTSLPDAFQNFTELKMLYIYSKSKIDLPISLSNCKNVILFKLSGIINEYPECINGMDSLGNLEIDCGENGGFDSLSDGMNNLTRLHTLRIENPKLKYLPKSLSQTKLEFLEIRGAKLKNYKFPIEYNQLPLKHIELFASKVGEFPPFLYDLTTIEEIKIIGGYFDSMRNPQPQKNWNNLKSLTISGTELSALPDSLGYCRKLQTVDIQHNRLTTVPRSFANLGERLCFYWFGNPWKTLPKEMDWNCRDLNPCSVGYSNLPPAKRR